MSSPATVATHASSEDTDRATEPARPVSFTLRVAAVWTTPADAPHETDGQHLFRQCAPMTGRLAVTGAGRDVTFTDLEL